MANLQKGVVWTMIHHTTRRKLQEIKTKVKSPITNMREFKDDDAVIDKAVNMYYEQLKKDRHLK